jgi:hypothetical protein
MNQAAPQKPGTLAEFPIRRHQDPFAKLHAYLSSFQNSRRTSRNTGTVNDKEPTATESRRIETEVTCGA